MTMSGLAGALIGAAFGVFNAALILRLLVPRLRAVEKGTTARERAAFERRIAILKGSIYAFEVAVFAAVGYFVAGLLGW